MKTRNLRSTPIPLAIVGLAILTLWIGALGPADAKGYMTNEFRTALDRPLKLLLLPPQADFIKAKTLVTEEMVAESHALEDAAVTVIMEDLQAKGYEVLYLSPDEIRSNSELGELVSEVEKRYDAEWVKIVRKPKKVRHRRYSIGEPAVTLGAAFDVDGLLISRVQAVGTTTGKQVMAAFFGGSLASYARLDLAVIDADEGDVHGYFFFAAQCSLKQLTKKPNVAMKKATLRALETHPDSDEVLEARKLKKLGVEEEEEEQPSDDIVSEFEALLAAKEAPDTEKPETEEQSKQDATKEKEKEKIDEVNGR
jgi:hypothetical protein